MTLNDLEFKAEDAELKSHEWRQISTYAPTFSGKDFISIESANRLLRERLEEAPFMQIRVHGNPFVLISGYPKLIDALNARLVCIEEIK